ncbi:MAG: SDR family oxidoreductase [Saprospiraceae bacterium]|nr:SDR family oxidoreductase [Saprospiraceae bacterium]
MSAFSLKDKTAVITGAGSGIGRSIALKFAKQGANVHILDINQEHTLEVKKLIESDGGKCQTHICNVAKQAEVMETFKQISQEGRIDILVNNAGIGFVGNVEQTKEEDLDRLYSVNIKGVYNCLYAVIPLMKAAGGGTILNMASVAGSVGIADRFGYSMTKGAVLTMTYSVALDYINDNIRCNSISPARVHTPFVDAYLKKNYPGKEKEVFAQLEKSQPIGRMGQPDEIASLAVYLCSEEAAFITGCDYPIDGGFIKLVP